MELNVGDKIRLVKEINDIVDVGDEFEVLDVDNDIIKLSMNNTGYSYWMLSTDVISRYFAKNK